MKDYFVNYLVNEGILFTSPSTGAAGNSEASATEESFDDRIVISNKRILKRPRV